MLKFKDILQFPRLDRSSKTNLFFGKISLSETNIELLLACVVGIGAGFTSVFFRSMLHLMHHFFFHVVYPWLSDFSPYLLPLIPVAGALMLLPFLIGTSGAVSGY